MIKAMYAFYYNQCYLTKLHFVSVATCMCGAVSRMWVLVCNSCADSGSYVSNMFLVMDYEFETREPDC